MSSQLSAIETGSVPTARSASAHTAKPLSGHYQVSWIGPKHASQVARLEAQVHPRGYRAGRRDIRAQLAEAEAEGRNLSTGLFFGRRLVAYCLRYLEPDRRQICTCIGIDEPPGLNLDGPGIYLADVVTDPRHRIPAALHVPRMVSAGSERDDLRGLPVEAFCTEDLLPVWEQRATCISRAGLKLILWKAFHDPILDKTLYWLRFEQRLQPVFNSTRRRLASTLKDVQTVETDDGPVKVGLLDASCAWDMLEPHWDALLAQTPGATIFSSHAFLRIWWQQLLIKRSLVLVVVLAGENDVRAIAPMQVSDKWWLGRRQRCLGFLGNSSEVDRPVVLAAEKYSGLAPVIADYLMLHRNRWDCVVLSEQQTSSHFLKAMTARLQSAGFLITLFPGGECSGADVSGSWDAYLASRSRPQRKSVRRHLRHLRSAGRVTVDVFDSSQGQEQAFERYLQLEKRSWKSEAGLGLAKTSAHLAFYRALIRRYAEENAVHFRFLTLDGRDIAANFGLLWKGTLYSIGIVHDEAYRDYSPGFVLTALELEEACGRMDYCLIDYLGGFLTNKRGWASHSISTTWLYAHRRDLGGYSFHFYHFHCMPRVKAQLNRFNLLQPVLRAKKLSLRFR